MTSCCALILSCEKFRGRCKKDLEQCKQSCHCTV